MSLPENDPVFTKQIIEFLTVSNEFCHFTEKVAEYSKEDIIDYYRRILPLLYLKGSLVKSVTPSSPDDSERFVTEEEWELLFNTIRNKLYPDDHFWMSSDPHDEDAELEKAGIGECIADIYQDMKDFLTLYQKNRYTAKENAVHDICTYYHDHWGPAATKALYALHLLFQRSQSI
ncbi:MAG: DUF5063 domain-containing protein [Lentimicrobiaceae bacterium]|nr:DUF5063 domain-containing protein [Lentimicrobiaceae bacterium]MCB9024325.1 DUF5063 domain-containing protein [Lentimicrobiaceae bacterium]MCO5264710.1 DUF5063 domain-containing protein [Lentimicrobium sp.]